MYLATPYNVIWLLISKQFKPSSLNFGLRKGRGDVIQAKKIPLSKPRLKLIFIVNVLQRHGKKKRQQYHIIIAAWLHAV